MLKLPYVNLDYGTCKHFVSILEAIQKEISHLMVVKPESKRDEKAWVFSYEDLQSMHYLHASICELIRLYQPVLLDSQHALHNDVLLDRIIVCRGIRR